MKFCATYRVPHGNWRQVLQMFSSLTPEERADVGEGVLLIGRWHDMSSRSGVAILESDDAAAVQRFIGRWNSHMDIDLAPVLDDEETAAVAKQILADHESR
jgi:hypothetical protein